MANSVDLKRTTLKLVYPYSEKWSKRVDKMSEQQVIAVYFRMVSKGQIKT